MRLFGRRHREAEARDDFNIAQRGAVANRRRTAALSLQSARILRAHARNGPGAWDLFASSLRMTELARAIDQARSDGLATLHSSDSDTILRLAARELVEKSPEPRDLEWLRKELGHNERSGVA